MLVSVVIPTYNSSFYLIHALESVVSQTYKEFEIIVVDDGSTDNTEEVVRNFPFPILYLKVANGGPAKARNIGIKNSQGDFVAFLDADDLWLPRKLEKQIKSFGADPELMMVFTENLWLCDNCLTPNPFSKREKLINGDIVKNIFLYSYVGTPTVMVRKCIFNTVGYFDESLKVAEDDNLWLRIAINFKINLIDEVLVHFRLTGESLSRTPGNIGTGEEKHLKLIEIRYPELKERLGRFTIRRKKSNISFSQGYFFFSNSQSRLARNHFFRSLFYYPSIRNMAYIFFSFLPDTVISWIRAMKR